MIFNMMAAWTRALLLLGLATAVLANPMMGIEVRHDNLTSPCDLCSAQSAALSFARSRAFDFVRCSPAYFSTTVLLEKCLEGHLMCTRSMLNTVRFGSGIVVIQSCDPIANWAQDNHMLTSSQY
jgi:hypothetical protein